MRFIGLLMVAGVIGFSNSAEGQIQNLDEEMVPRADVEAMLAEGRAELDAALEGDHCRHFTGNQWDEDEESIYLYDALDTSGGGGNIHGGADGQKVVLHGTTRASTVGSLTGEMRVG